MGVVVTCNTAGEGEENCLSCAFSRGIVTGTAMYTHRILPELVCNTPHLGHMNLGQKWFKQWKTLKKKSGLAIKPNKEKAAT